LPPRKKKAPAKKKRKDSPLEDRFLEQVLDAGLPEPVREYQFDRPVDGKKRRRWRADMAWPDKRVMVEIEGGVWGGKYCYKCKQRAAGRHNNPAGFEKDCEKYGHGFAQGWRLLRVTSKMIKSGLGIALLAQFFQEELCPA
jgi:very-short-patch-repair endonuclease